MKKTYAFCNVDLSLIVLLIKHPMNPIRSIRTCCLIFSFGMLTGCLKDQVKDHYSYFKPVYKTRAEVQAAARSISPEDISTPGKLFLRGNYVFLNEVDKGIHIIDFSNPASPKNIAFLRIPGCQDMAVRGNFLYADCYTDLVTVDITDPQKAVVKQFIEGVFPHRRYTRGFLSDTSRIITEWVRVDTVVTTPVGNVPTLFNGGILAGGDMSIRAMSAGTGVTNGVGGSMARFGLLDDRLYTVSWSDLKVFNTLNPGLPVHLNTIELNQGDIETIFPYSNKLFIGSQTGMFIYDASNRDKPTKLGQFTHARACDPVVADDTHAYVTLRSNSFCTGFSNQLDVVDIGTLTSPKLLRSYPMTGPAGLAKDGNLLFICDGPDGLRILDASKPDKILPISQVTGIRTYDVIARDGLALTVAEDGLYFISYTDPAKARVIGKMTIK
jgi:hypothetical protein